MRFMSKGRRPSNDAEGKFEDVNQSMGRGDFDGAMAIIDRHIRDNPSDVDAYIAKMQMLEGVERWDDAIACAEQMPPHDSIPEYKVMIKKSEMHAEAGRLKEALDHVDRAQKAGAPQAETHIAKSDIFAVSSDMRHGDMRDKAAEHALEACRLDEGNGAYRAQAAGILLAKCMGKIYDNADETATLKRSIRLGKEAIRLGHREPLAYYNIGRALTAMEKHGRALKYYRYVLKMDPGFTKARGMIGACMVQHGDKSHEHYRKAMRYIDDALNAEPTLTFLLKAKAMAYAYLGDMVNSMRYFEAFTKKEPDDLSGWLMMMTAFLAAGDIKNAERCQKEAARISPDVPLIKEMLEGLDGDGGPANDGRPYAQ